MVVKSFGIENDRMTFTRSGGETYCVIFLRESSSTGRAVALSVSEAMGRKHARDALCNGAAHSNFCGSLI